jgi:hypothetical protein
MHQYFTRAPTIFPLSLNAAYNDQIDAAIAGLIGAGIGAVAGLVAGVIGGWQQRLAEAQRWGQGRADEIWRTERQSLIELTTLTVTGCQAMAWISWSASAKSLEDVRIEVDIYNERMRDLLPRVFSAQAAASGLDDQTYEKIQRIIARLSPSSQRPLTSLAR